MEKIDILEEKIGAAIKIISELRTQNAKLQNQYQKLIEENQLLHSENHHARKILTDLDTMKEERRILRQKLERLLEKYQRASL